MQTLIDVSSKKLDVVDKRKFGEPNEHGVFQHLPDESPKLIVTWADMDIPAIEKAYEDIKPLVLYEPCFKETRDKIKHMMEIALPNYKVKCDEENNPPNVVDSGNILVRVSDYKNSYVDVIF